MLSVLRLDDIAPLTGPKPAGAMRVRRTDRADLRVLRRQFLKGAMAVGTGAGLAVLGVLPPARRAHALPAEGWQIIGHIVNSPCGTRHPAGWSNYAQPHNCLPGCGPSTIYPRACNTNPAGWHRAGGCQTVCSGGVCWRECYRLRPNGCWPAVSGKPAADGWMWQVPGCAQCNGSGNRRWRCHDGWTNRNGGAYFRTICRWCTASGPNI
jgi:hypothetical protein